MSLGSITDGTTATGWVCPHCGAWARMGEAHACYRPREAPCYSPMPPDYSPVLARIAAALERLAALAPRTWVDCAEEVLKEHAGAWEDLAAL